ncbi:MAG: hypothetical protein AAGU77_08205 [Bacillota bacterium]
MLESLTAFVAYSLRQGVKSDAHVVRFDLFVSQMDYVHLRETLRRVFSHGNTLGSFRLLSRIAVRKV